MKLAFLATLLAIALTGCQQAPSQGGSGSHSANSESPAQRLRDQLSAGSYQFDAGVDTISRALQASGKISAGTKNPVFRQALAEVEEILNVVGKRLTEYTDEPPELVEVEASFAELDEHRLRAIEAGNDSIHELEEAIGILRAISAEQASGYTNLLSELINDLVEIVDDIGGAVEAFGGTIEPETSE